ncbi:hypothetical protein PSACC_02649 [Paramicrosporidium saccamoebae]|uniref:Protein transport protein BOS1 n=1 Tax=Paramicrosporidium saccamoebae TaxID=1246581 RepID=A0A2H9TIV0_9FUNG|nr:hypothetical protein PSACC_02649 [Paramicrosporidium saccamoebae]
MNAQLTAKAERQLQAVRSDMERLEGDGTALQDVSAGLATAMLTLRSLEESLNRETSMEKRQQGKQRIKELRAEHQSLKDSVERFRAKCKESERATVRTALLTPGTVRPTVALTEAALQEREDSTLRYASHQMDEYITIGTGTLDSLRTQRGALKSAQRRVLDVGTTLGLSQSVMRVISRRTAQDRYIM